MTRIGKVVWQGNIGRTSGLWSIDSAFQVGWLSNDGQHFVTGYEGLNFLPLDYKRDQIMFTFFSRGKLTSEVRLNQIIADFSKLQKADSKYRWASYLGLNACGYLAVATVEGKRVQLDLATGRVVNFKPQKTHGVAQWSTYQDMMECYEFQYPRDYSIKESFAHDGTPLGHFFLEQFEGSVEDILTYGSDYATRMTLEEFVFERARAKYSADGADSSTYATDVVNKKIFRNPNNLNVIEFYLTVVHQSETKTEKRTAGPIYAISIAQLNEAHRVLIFKPRSDREEELPQEKETVKKIVDTVRILK